MLTMRERMFKVIREGHGDAVIWAPRWDLFFQAMEKSGRMPHKYKGKSYFDLTRSLGMGITAPRCEIIKKKVRNVEIIMKKDGNTTLTEYHTAFGKVTSTFRSTPELEAEGVRGIVTEYMIKKKTDFDAVKFIIENTKIEPDYEGFIKIVKEIGDDGLAFAKAGYCPFHDIIRNYMGYEKTYYALYDYPNQLESLLDTLDEQFEKVIKLIINSPAEIITCDGHFDGQLTPPPIYRKHLLPCFKDFSNKIHSAGKLFASHTDADISGLLELFLESGFDIAEAFTPPPMCRVPVQRAMNIWGNRITIWGCVASVMLSRSTPEHVFKEHIHNLLDEIAPGNNVILAVGDNVPTDASFERLINIGEIIHERGNYPISTRLNYRKEIN